MHKFKVFMLGVNMCMWVCTLTLVCIKATVNPILSAVATNCSMTAWLGSRWWQARPLHQIPSHSMSCLLVERCAWSVITVDVVLLVWEISFCTCLQVEFAQSGENVLFSVVCKDFFKNSRTCLLSVSEANELIPVSIYAHIHVYVRTSGVHVTSESI